MSREKQIEELATEIYTLFRSHPMSRALARHLYDKGWRKQSEGELTKAHIQAHYEAIYALADMVCQFGYSTTFRKQDAVCDGGLSALEYAFGALEDCGCKMNSNGTITDKNLWAFQEEIRAKIEGGAE